MRTLGERLAFFNEKPIRNTSKFKVRNGSSTKIFWFRICLSYYICFFEVWKAMENLSLGSNELDVGR